MGDWRTWVLLGGRGAGKTRAGAEWIAGAAAGLGEGGRVYGAGAGRIALVGASLHDVREVMIDGPSGLRRLPWRAAPRYEASRRRLLFSSGAVGLVFSAEDPDSLRGPQFGAAWADELCAWKRPEATLEMLRLGLRLGARPRLVVTTTPRPIAALRRLLAEPGCVRSDAPTLVNQANLSPSFLEGMTALYGGTRLAAQELEGRLVEADGALWRLADLRRAGGARPVSLWPVVVAVDPPAGTLSGEGGDACGIIVAGRWENSAYVLADRTARGLSPGGWAAVVAQAAEEFGAVRVVAEANQGGRMVSAVLAAAGVRCPVRLVHARLGKRSRAEPVAALYEQGRVVHCADLLPLEEELMALGAVEGGASPDRADALVWAVTDLLIDGGGEGPRVRML